MNVIFTICLIALGSALVSCTPLGVKGPGPWHIASRGQPWPLPQVYTTSNAVYTIDPTNFEFDINIDCDILDQAIARYKALLFEPAFAPVKWSQINPMMTKVNMKLLSDECESVPYYEMDESYNLTVLAEAELVAKSTWGLIRGLETLSQLVYQADKTFLINATTIHDFPRFPFRGIMLDTSRHFLSVDTIKENLDLMAQNKFNVFHWHLVDDNSFPYVSTTYANLSGAGAYQENLIYSPSDVQDIINYASLRGICVMPEFDTPGHTQSWGAGYPELLTQCYEDDKPVPGSYGPMDPSNESTYTFLKNLIHEIATVFPDGFFHLGGDEVNPDCWSKNPDVLAFMKTKNITDPIQLEKYHIDRVTQLLYDNKKTPVVWQEVFDNNPLVSNDTIVHIWTGNGKDEMEKITSAGHLAIRSEGWYLNYISYGIDWENYYKLEPTEGTTDETKHLAKGGAACMWGEYVDGTNVIPRTWPRASAVAERLWSSAEVVDAGAAYPRIEEQRCRLLRRGYNVEPITGSGFCTHQ